LQTQAAAVMAFRVSRAFETRPDLTLADRNEGRSLNFLANGVVSFSDVLLAWMQLTQLSDTRAEEALIMSTLKAAIKLDERQLDIALVELESNKSYYLTTVRGTAGISMLCHQLGDGIVNTLIGKLQFPGNGGKAKLIVVETGDDRGMVAVLKSAVDNPQCRTHTQQQILDFLCMVVHAPVVGPRYWYPVVDNKGEETGEIAFNMAVRDALLRPHCSALFKGWFGTTPRDDIKLAYDMFSRSGELTDTDDNGADVSANVHTPIAIGGTGVFPAVAGGALDPRTVLQGVRAYDQHHGTPSIAELTAWARMKPPQYAHVPAITPGALPTVTDLTIHGTLIVSAKLDCVRTAIQSAKCIACRLRPPPILTSNAKMDTALNKFVWALMAVSGEGKPGENVYTGASSTGLMKIEDYDQPVTIDNPRRGHTTVDSLIMGPANDTNTTIDHDDPEEEFFPAGEPTTTFQKGDALYARMITANMAHNCPYLTPGD
jgi:hypothetical protein